MTPKSLPGSVYGRGLERMTHLRMNDSGRPEELENGKRTVKPVRDLLQKLEKRKQNKIGHNTHEITMS